MDELLAGLRQESGIVVEARGPAESICAAIRTIGGVEQVAIAEQDGDSTSFLVRTRGRQDLREAVSQKLVSSGWPIRRLDLKRSTLEERFVQAVTQDTLAEVHREAV
jgi:ABC-2 type transport system ATP-binding protein